MIAVHRGHLVVAGAQGEALAVVAGRARERATIGDWVVVDARGAVSARLPRHGVLARAGQDLAANVDVAFVVTSANRDLNARRLERFVAVAAAGGCAPVLVLNKTDLVVDPEPTLAILRAVAPGVPVVATSAQRGDGVDALDRAARPRPHGRADRLVGRGQVDADQCAAGQRAPGHRPDPRPRRPRAPHDHEPGALRPAPRRGPAVDTPGLRLPRMGADPAGVAAAFADVEELAAGCRFSDCRHETEPGCAVRAAIAPVSSTPRGCATGARSRASSAGPPMQNGLFNREY